MVENNQEMQELKEINLNSMSDRKIGESGQKVEKPNLDGQEVTITDVSLKETGEVRTTQDGTKKYKTVIFSIEYDGNNRENYGGVTAFIYEDGNVGEPTIWTEGKSAAAVLFNKWLNFVGKKVEDVSYRDFFLGLTGLKVKLVNKLSFFQGEEFKKNIIDSFIDGGKTPSSKEERSNAPSKPLKDSERNNTITKEEKCVRTEENDTECESCSLPHSKMEEHWNKSYHTESRAQLESEEYNLEDSK